MDVGKDKPIVWRINAAIKLPYFGERRPYGRGKIKTKHISYAATTNKPIFQIDVYI